LDAELPGANIAKFIRTVKEDIIFGRPCVFLLTDNDYPFQADLVFEKPLDLLRLRAAIDGFEHQHQIGVAVIA